MKKIYLIIHNDINGYTDDDRPTICSSFEQAKEAALSEWRYLTTSEQVKTFITAEAYDIPDSIPEEEIYDYIADNDLESDTVIEIKSSEDGEPDVWESGGFAREIKSIRAKTGLSQAKLSRAIGIPLRTYEDWEAAKFEPNDFKKKAVLDYMNKLIQNH